MSQAHRDLWPAEIGVSTMVAPVAILREQAALLSEKTQGIVIGEVDPVRGAMENARRVLTGQATPEGSSSVSGRIEHAFRIRVPALGDYRYELLRVIHDYQLYPLTLVYYPADEAFSLTSQDEFIAELTALLGREETLNIVHSLLAQVQQ